MKTAAVLVVYAVLLLSLGLYAFFAAPEGANPKTALIVTGGCAALVLIAAGLASRGAKAPRLARAGRIAGIILPVLFALVFAQRAWGTTDPAKAYLSNTLWALTAVSAAAFIAMLAVRPRPASSVGEGSQV